MKKFVDTAPFIYLIENNPEFATKVIEIFSTIDFEETSYFTSTITIMEFSVKPEKDGRKDIISNFNELLKNLDFTIISIDQEIAQKAAQLRAQYSFLKSMDALQIAAAVEFNCESFITNDHKLKRVDEITVTLLNES